MGMDRGVKRISSLTAKLRSLLTRLFGYCIGETAMELLTVDSEFASRGTSDVQTQTIDIEIYKKIQEQRENKNSISLVPLSNFCKNCILVGVVAGNIDTIYIPGFRKPLIANGDRCCHSVRSSTRRNSLSLVNKIR